MLVVALLKIEKFITKTNILQFLKYSWIYFQKKIKSLIDFFLKSILELIKLLYNELNNFCVSIWRKFIIWHNFIRVWNFTKCLFFFPYLYNSSLWLVFTYSFVWKVPTPNPIREMKNRPFNGGWHVHHHHFLYIERLESETPHDYAL